MTWAEIRRRYLAGASAQDLADDAGVARNTVILRLRAMGVKIRGRGGNRRQGLKGYIPAVLRLYYDQGMSAAEVGKALGRCEATVLRTLRRVGLGIRRRGIPAPATKRRQGLGLTRIGP